MHSVDHCFSLTHVSSAVPTRDPVETTRTLEGWLSTKLDGAKVAVSDLKIPKAGFSNETILGRADWTAADGVADGMEFVLRIEPTSHQLFADPDALRQAQVMMSLAPYVPVPRIWLTGSDPGVFGAPFFVMQRVHGRITSDVPSWHKRGWVTELDVGSRTLLHDNALTQLTRLHAIDTTEGFGFLGERSGNTMLSQYVERIREWYEWCEPVRIHDPEVIDEAMQFITTEMPGDDRASIVWGDARPGNVVIGDDLSVSAMLDWEGATLGPPEIDVAWWVMFDEFLCEANGLQRLEGIPDRLGTFDRYEQISGHQLQSIKYYEVLAGLVLSLINSRLSDLLVTTGKASPELASEFVKRVTGMTARTLAR
jgi:aminoglycoside phosphotransferase (APT) family kinase protein